jgi:hypothetical protein
MTVDPRWDRIAPGVYDDGDGGMHVDLPELLAAHGIEDTPENRRHYEAEIHATIGAYGIPIEDVP